MKLGNHCVFVRDEAGVVVGTKGTVVGVDGDNLTVETRGEEKVTVTVPADAVKGTKGRPRRLPAPEAAA